MDAQWSAIGRSVKNRYCCEHCVSIWATLLPSLYHHCASFGRPIASIERSQWQPLCLHSATTATIQPPWRWFCLHSASFARPVAPLQQIWSFKEGTWVVLQQLHRNRTFWVWATTERPGHFSGCSKVARRSQPCVKGALCLPCTTTVPPLADQWHSLSDHCGDHCASIRRPRQPLSHHDNGSASTLPPLHDLSGT